MPLTHTPQDDTTAADYSGVPTSVTFATDDTEKTFTFTAAADDADDDSDSVLLGFGALPDDVSEGSPDEATVTITDDPADVPSVQVSFAQASYTVAEGSTVTVTVELSAAPEREVEIPLTHTPQGDTTAADYSGVPTSVTFESDDTEKTFTFTAAADDADDDGDSVLLGFGTPLPADVTAGATDQATVTITDDDAPQRTVSFDKQFFTVGEGSHRVLMQVDLSRAVNHQVTIPVTTTHGNGTEASDYDLAVTSAEDYYAGNATWIPLHAGLIFTPAEMAKIVRVTAVDDSIMEDDEILELGFGTLPEGISPGSIRVATVTITDNDGDANAPPTFDSPPTFEVPENQTSIGTVRASDSDAADEVTGYVMTGGADQALFSIRETSGVLTFDAAPDFEESRDADGNNAYLLTVQASSGTGSRLKTAEQSITVTVTRLGEEGDFRIVDGPSESEGRVEVFHAGRWGTVCDDVFKKPKVSVFNYDEDGNLILDEDGNPTETEYDNEAPALVCQTMGYETGEYAAGYGQSGVDHQPADYWPPRSSYPASGPLPIWLDDVMCVAGEPGPSVDRLPAPMGHCHYAGWGLHNCTHAEDAGVRCSMASTAQVDGPLLALTWRTPRDGFAAPDGGDFAVRADGAAVAVTGAALVEQHALLTLVAPVLAGQSVSVDYLGSAMHPLADASGAHVPAWTDLAAENLTGAPEDAAWAAVLALAAAPGTAAPGLRAPFDRGMDPASLSLAGAGLTDADLAALWWPGGPRPDGEAPDAARRIRSETSPGGCVRPGRLAASGPVGQPSRGRVVAGGPARARKPRPVGQRAHRHRPAVDPDRAAPARPARQPRRGPRAAGVAAAPRGAAARRQPCRGRRRADAPRHAAAPGPGGQRGGGLRAAVGPVVAAAPGPRRQPGGGSLPARRPGDAGMAAGAGGERRPGTPADPPALAVDRPGWYLPRLRGPGALKGPPRDGADRPRDLRPPRTTTSAAPRATRSGADARPNGSGRTNR